MNRKGTGHSISDSLSTSEFSCFSEHPHDRTLRRGPQQFLATTSPLEFTWDHNELIPRLGMQL